MALITNIALMTDESGRLCCTKPTDDDKWDSLSQYSDQTVQMCDKIFWATKEDIPLTNLRDELRYVAERHHRYYMLDYANAVLLPDGQFREAAMYYVMARLRHNGEACALLDTVPLPQSLWDCWKRPDVISWLRTDDVHTPSDVEQYVNTVETFLQRQQQQRHQ